ncbi:Asp23/Gls24 family envelope stress response protein [Microbacterium sp. PI-1]|uniref:Asp23/Gls24 family envelope stress response protein n=2 Tax=Microbacteriaceae TaxID=85023 RepID=A0ABY4J0S1_9MICO|nr:MAG: Asp23/Gls24 family envelope stress response protein [Actinobacteria bacterium HGW-Actinobacteria-11]QEA28667.1 Asp23/Gls24 family envelope stress response protein [Microbacterium sp. CBA3102]TCJ28209.1 Asp23/Gls24 family envelope stress response protein [Microbacterium sp. PI-1]TFB17173.1 Asp23/Gls24 family envelope stress response protein [Microbacterium sp. 3H14]UPL18586.1 Asp23/Gls24 family envelope stress response protein [Microbacterium aurugineum]
MKELKMANVTGGAQPKAQVVAPQSGTAAGKTTIEDAVVAKIAGIAAREVAGVYALGGGAARMVGAIRDALNTTDLSQGISVEVGETQVAVDVTIVAEYPVSLQKVADEVRAAIHRAMVELVGMEVAEVNVTVNDVHIPSDDEDEGTQEARVQ